MTFMDKVGSAFSKAGHGIGTAWTAATDNAVGDAIGAAVGSDSFLSNNLFEPALSPAKTVVGGAVSGINAAYSYGISRPVSTALMWQDWSKTFDGGYWRQNWNRSADISVGQAATVNIDQIAGVGPDFTKAENNPFGDENKANREQYFYHTNQGQLMSGAFDLIGNIYGDPIAVAGKGLKAAKAAKEGFTGLTDMDRARGAVQDIKDLDTVPYVQKTPEVTQAVRDALAAPEATSSPVAGRIASQFPVKPKDSKLLDETIAKSPTESESQFYAYDFPVANVKVGDTVESKDYIRASKHSADEKVFKQQGSEDLPTMLRINTDAGAPVLDANRYLSDDPNVFESEDVLMGKGSKLKITGDSQQEVLDPTGKPMMARVVEAQLVDSPHKPPAGKDRWGRSVNKVFTETDGKSSAEIAAMPQFRNLPDAGIIGYFLGRANEVFPGGTEYNTTRRWQMKADVMGVAMGDPKAIERIKNTNTHLAEEYAKMGDTVPAANATIAMRWDKDNQGVLAFYAGRAGELDQRDAVDLQRQQVMYDRLLQANHRDNTEAFAPGIAAAKTRLPNTIKYKMDAYKLKDSYEPKGLGGTAKRWVIGNAQTRVPGSVNIRESERGREDMLNTLSQVRNMDGKTKKALESAYVNAKTDSERVSAVQTADSEIFKAYAKKYNVSPALAREVLKRIHGQRDTWKGYLGSRIYSAQDADLVDLYDPLDDVRHIISKPLAISQTENHMQLMDPRLLDKTFRAVSKSRMLERIAKRAGQTSATGSMSHFLDKTDEGKAILDQVLGTYTSAWKDAMLFRAAYPLRNQVDNQARLIARIGMMQTMMSLKTSVGGATKWLLEAPDSDAKSVRNIFKGDQSTMADASRGHLITKDGKVRRALMGNKATGRVVKSNVDYKGVEGALSPAQDDADLYAIVGKIGSTGGAQADLGRETEARLLGEMRGTGEWGITDVTSDNWYDNWHRAIRQIGASPTLNAAAKTQNLDALADFVRKDPAAKREWAEMSPHYDGEVYDWLDRVVNHVNLYLPTDQLKAILTGGLKDGKVPVFNTDGSQATHWVKQADGTMAKKPLFSTSDLNDTTPIGDGLVPGNVVTNLANNNVRDVQGMEVDAHVNRWVSKNRELEAAKSELDKAIQDHKSAIQNYHAVKEQNKVPRATSVKTKLPPGKRRNKAQMAADKAATEANRAAKARVKTAIGEAAKRRKEAIAKRQKASAKYNKLAPEANTIRKNLAFAEQRERNTLTVQNAADLPKDWNEGSFAQAKKYFEDIDNRMPVHGENFSPVTVNPIAKQINKVRKNWYQIASDMPETVMGRSPLYRHAFQEYMRDAIDNLGAEGIDEEMLGRIRRGADQSARKEIGRILYDSTNTSNAADALKYIAPFFSAWQDSMTKWGGLIYDDPKVGSYLSQGWMAPETAGLTVDSEGNRVDADGNTYDQDGKLITDPKFKGNGEYIVLPKWAGGELIPGGGGSFKINKQNLNILFQGNPPWLPGVGPLVQVPTNEISKRAFPEAVGKNPILKFVLPFGNTNDSIVDQGLTPTWLKQAKNAFGNSKDHSDVFMQLQAQEYDKWSRGERKTKPTSSEIATKTRNWFILRAAMSNGAPVSITPVPGNQLYLDKAREYQQKYAGTETNWMDKYAEDFPGYFYSAQSLGQNNTGINATLKGFDRTKQYRKQINENPDLGWMFVGADNLNGQYDSNIHNWQEAQKSDNGQTFRSQNDPQTAINDAQAEKGWIEYNKMTTTIDLELQKRGLSSVQQRGAEDLAAAKKGYTQFLAQQNLQWGIAYNQRDTSKMLKMVAVARSEQAADPEFAKRDDQVALNQYLDSRKQLMAMLATRESSDINSDGNADIKAAWDGYVGSLKDQSIGFGQIYDRVLEHNDDLKQVF